MFKGWLRAYEWTLDKVIAYKAVMLMVTFATIVGTVWLYIIIPKGFFPSEDTGFMLGDHRGGVRQLVRSDGRAPAPGGGHHSPGQGGRLHQFHRRRRRSQRDHQLRPHVRRAQAEDASASRATVVVQRLRRAVAGVPGMKTNFRSIQNINIGGRITKGEYQYTLQSGDTEALYRLAPGDA